jgi:hypothetical protein
VQPSRERAGRIPGDDVAGGGHVPGDAEQFLDVGLAGDQQRGERGGDALGAQREAQ